MSDREEWMDRLATLERRVARQRRLAWIALSLGVLIGLSLYGAPRLLAQAPRTTGDILTVRGLVVVDDKGIERVRIGAPLPDPIVNGRRVPRQGVVSGMLIFDADGDERGWSGNNRNDNYVSVQAVPSPLIEIKQNGKTRVFSVNGTN